uniref:Uncharacterized protein n=1 Tax=Coccidioides posadasii RMSCC 3488 TaxID=454284 RepID=A0A0J6FCG0_COCPO|nr:hypothetical protein CPAG_03316 [Coccidioides posadasii RMSCC 3488]
MRPAFPCGWEHTTPEGGKERTADRSRCRSFRTAVPFPVPGRRRLSSLLGVDAAGARAVKPWESLLAAGHSCNQSALGKPSIRARAPLLAGRVAWHGLAFPPSAVETSDPEGAAGQSACGFLACLTQLSPVRPVSYADTRQHPRHTARRSSLVASPGSQEKDPIPLLRRRTGETQLPYARLFGREVDCVTRGVRVLVDPNLVYLVCVALSHSTPEQIPT